MKLKIRISDGQLIIYREIIGVITLMIFTTAAFIGFGILCINISEDAGRLWLVFGGGSLIIGVLLLLWIPVYYSRIKNKGGAVLLQAGKEGLLLSPEVNMSQTAYGWNDISKIVFTNNFKHTD